jgi:hypothetical protein
MPIKMSKYKFLLLFLLSLTSLGSQVGFMLAILNPVTNYQVADGLVILGDWGLVIFIGMSMGLNYIFMRYIYKITSLNGFVISSIFAGLFSFLEYMLILVYTSKSESAFMGALEIGAYINIPIIVANILLFIFWKKLA